jgi:hypothetical protein
MDAQGVLSNKQSSSSKSKVFIMNGITLIKMGTLKKLFLLRIF